MVFGMLGGLIVGVAVGSAWATSLNSTPRMDAQRAEACSLWLNGINDPTAAPEYCHGKVEPKK